MAKQAGRNLKLKKNAVLIAGLRTTGWSANGAPIDVSDQDDAGLIKYLAGVLTDRQLEFTGEGYEEDGIMRAISLGTEAAHFLDDITLEFEDGTAISADVVLTAYSETGEMKDGQTFSFTLVTNGAWVVA